MPSISFHIPHRNSLYIFIFILIYQFPLAHAKQTDATKQVEIRYGFSIPSQDLQLALIDLATTTQATLFYPADIVESLKSNPVYGNMTSNRALDLMLEGTGLSAEVTSSGQISIQEDRAEAAVMIKKPIKDDRTIAPEIEEVVVTGSLTQSFKTSAAIKRESTHIIDVVTEEDIGKMPDENLAETLQRIPGVQIERREGEGSLIRVRGLDNNILLLNGESFLTGMELFQIEDDRSFEGSLETIPSALLHRVEVYKTPQAHHVEGSIGATIDLLSRKAFDVDHPFLAAELNVNKGTFSTDRKTSGFFALGANWNNKFAFLGSLSLNERTNKGESTALFGSGGFLQRDFDKNSLLIPHKGTEESRLQYRRRFGNSFNFQYRLNNKTDIELDWFYLRGKITAQKHRLIHSIDAVISQNVNNEDGNAGEGESIDGIASLTNGVSREERALDYEPTKVYNGDSDTGSLSFYSQGLTKAPNENILSSGEITNINANNLTLKIHFRPSPYLTITTALQQLNSTMRQRTGRISTLLGSFISNRWVGESSATGWENVTLNEGINSIDTIYQAASRPTFNYVNPKHVFDPKNLAFNDQYAFGSDSDQSIYTGRFDAVYGPESKPIAIKFGLRLSNTEHQFNQLRYLFNYSKTLGAASPTLFDENGKIRKATDFNRLDKPQPGEFNIGVREAIYYDLCGNGGLIDGKTCDIDGDGKDDNIPIGPYGYHTNNVRGLAARDLRTSNGLSLLSILYGLQPGSEFALPRYSPSATYSERPEYYHNANNIFSSGNHAYPFVLPDLNRVTNDVGRWIQSITPNTPVSLWREPLSSWFINEHTSAGYLEMDFIDDYHAYEINMGIRAVQTELEINTAELSDENINWRLTSERPNSGSPLSIHQKRSLKNYRNYLPSVNVKWHLAEDIVLRAGASRAIARPRLQDIGRGNIPVFTGLSLSAFEETQKPTSLKNGNPSLNPYRISQYDMALEYYFTEKDSLAANIFNKDIKDFVVNRPRVVLGPEFGAEGGILEMPENIASGQIRGIELSLQKIWTCGFGIYANATYIDSATDDSSYSRDQLPFPGVSKINTNIVAFFENNDIGIRMAYNQRSDYLSPFSPTVNIIDTEFINNLDDTPFALFHKGGMRLDARIIWNTGSRFSFYLDALNITKESESGYLEFKNIPAFYKQDESRFSVGLKMHLF